MEELGAKRATGASSSNSSKDWGNEDGHNEIEAKLALFAIDQGDGWDIRVALCMHRSNSISLREVVDSDSGKTRDRDGVRTVELVTHCKERGEAIVKRREV